MSHSTREQIFLGALLIIWGDEWARSANCTEFSTFENDVLSSDLGGDDQIGSDNLYGSGTDNSVDWAISQLNINDPAVSNAMRLLEGAHLVDDADQLELIDPILELLD